jgi:metal-responsive CopG/Arc/MetJ family transcriptional regulator
VRRCSSALGVPAPAGYTQGMKTAVSIPDDVFEEAERLVAELQTSRSQLYSRALQEFVARHAPNRLTEAMNRVIDEVGTEVDEFTQRTSRRVLEQVEW